MFGRKNSNKKNLVGLDIGSSSVKAVELQGKPGNLVLVNLGQESLQPDTVVDGQIMELNSVSQTIANVFGSHQIKTQRVAAGVSGSSVIVKNIIVPPMSKDELEESIDWHAEEHIPFDIADVSLDYQVVGSSDDSLHVLMAACKRDFVANIKQVIQLAGKFPAIIDVDAFALQNCYEVNYQPTPEQSVALLNIGASTMNINILHGVRSVFTRDVSVGGNQYTALLQKELGLTFEQAEAVKRGGMAPGETERRDMAQVLETVSDILALEIQKTFDFYRATSDDGEGTVQKILISGGGSKLPGLTEFLANRFGVPVEAFNPFRQIKVDARRFDPEYMREVMPELAVAVGLALRGVEA
ncbi:MAG: type pilus assembly protein PilM [Pyrinomonadaceae bacterium]|jgi:type IV pilus assembly protein PilM|nr:type pilus assembly protein PilM [Pyrinomonadaceae bacterium]MDQ1611290.1 type pilus assembly protein PilM [Pyrinomonadaceae bacterium]